MEPGTRVPVPSTNQDGRRPLLIIMRSTECASSLFCYYRNEKEPGLHVSSVVGASVTAGVVVAAIACVAVPQQNTTVITTHCANLSTWHQCSYRLGQLCLDTSDVFQLALPFSRCARTIPCLTFGEGILSSSAETHSGLNTNLQVNPWVTETYWRFKKQTSRAYYKWTQ